MPDGWTPDGKRPRFPLVLGTDGSGTVAGVGTRVLLVKSNVSVRPFPRRGKVAIAASFSLEEAAAADAPLAEGQVFGKVVLAVRRKGR